MDPWAGDIRPPRRWQAEALPAIVGAWRGGERRVVVHACTGAGKTRLTLALVRTVLATLREGWVVVVTCPRLSLVRQTVAALRAGLGPSTVAQYDGTRRDLARVVVASQQSIGPLVEALAMERLGVAAWVADEVHRTQVEGLNVWRDLPVRAVGLSATPYRSDGPLAGWERCVYAYPVEAAEADGVLVPLRPYVWDGPETDADTATLEMVRRYGEGPGLVSALDIADAEAYAGWMRERGVDAAAVHSRLPTAEQDRRIWRAMEAGSVLVHVDLLTEGRDLPPLQWLACRVPRGSDTAVVQEVGRIVRAHPGKDHARVLLPVPMRRGLATALGRGADLVRYSELAEAAERREARETDAEPVRRVLPLAERRERVDRLVAALRAALEAHGQPIETRAPERDPLALPSVSQLRYLRDLQRVTRYVQAPFGDRFRAVLADPDVLTAGLASELIGCLAAVRTAAQRHAVTRAHGRRALLLPVDLEGA